MPTGCESAPTEVARNAREVASCADEQRVYGAHTREIPARESERLRLRGWTSTDADALRRIYGDPVTMRYLGDGSTMPPDGQVGLYHPEGWPGVELGWLLDRTWWGEGLATEAAQLAAGWVWETLEVDQLIHLIHSDNHASFRVAAKRGAAFDQRMDLDGTAVDVYALGRPSAVSETPVSTVVLPSLSRRRSTATAVGSGARR